MLNLLESAGFSRSNPYYIVPQGRITSLTNMRDSERLDLLKEIAGTSVYENKRQESLRILEETQAKRDKIVDLLGRIEERLEELQAEQEELDKFTVQDRERRCLEYTLYQKELEEVDQALARVSARVAWSWDGVLMRCRSRMDGAQMWITIIINERNSSDAKRRSRYVRHPAANAF